MPKKCVIIRWFHQRQIGLVYVVNNIEAHPDLSLTSPLHRSPCHFKMYCGSVAQLPIADRQDSPFCIALYGWASKILFKRQSVKQKHTHHTVRDAQVGGRSFHLTITRRREERKEKLNFRSLRRTDTWEQWRFRMRGADETGSRWRAQLGPSY